MKILEQFHPSQRLVETCNSVNSPEMSKIMQRDLPALVSKDYDLVIVGGGMFGICAAWDAVLRGFSVALIERNDFCSGTSANSFKIVHGGIRYIQHGDIMRLRESCHERSALLRIAPHLVQPLPIVIPTYGHGKNGKVLLATGMLAYDVLTLDRNRRIPDVTRRIPWSRFLNRTEVLDLFPGLERSGLTGAALFCDGQMYNPTRLAVSFLRSAVAKGVEAANYAEAIDFVCSRERIVGVRVKDRATGQEFRIHGKVVLNAAGPWAENLLKRRLGLVRQGTYSRDACFVVRRRLSHRCALAIQGRTRDPDAILSRAARHLFIVPWRDYSLIGVWHLVYEGKPDDFTVTADELKAFIDEINWAYPDLELTLDDVLVWNAGLVPFGENTPGSKDLSYGKRSLIIDHAREDKLEGLVTLIGIRYTMARGDAAKAVDMVARKLNRCAPRPATDRIPVHGGDIGNFEDLVRTVCDKGQLPLSEPVTRALLHNYGSEHGRVLRYAAENPSWIETVAGTTVTRAEVVHAVREEMALKLGDVVFRRTDLATGENPGDKALACCAQLMAAELGWPPERMREEVEEVKRGFLSRSHMDNTQATVEARASRAQVN